MWWHYLKGRGRRILAKVSTRPYLGKKKKKTTRTRRMTQMVQYLCSKHELKPQYREKKKDWVWRASR
jgi:hypothetical protein